MCSRLFVLLNFGAIGILGSIDTGNSDLLVVVAKAKPSCILKCQLYQIYSHSNEPNLNLILAYAPEQDVTTH